MSNREAMKLALKALDTLVSPVGSIYAQARIALRTALAAEQPSEDIEALRRNDARYRWMKQEVKRIPPSWYLFGWDAAIDAAMEEDKT